MKKFMFLAAAFIAAISINACQPIVTGQFLYTVMPAPETETGRSMAWQAPLVSETAGEDLILQELAKVGTPYGQSAYSVSGEKKECDAKVIAAVNKAMDADEASDSYCTIGDYSGMTVVVYCNADDKGESGSTTTDFEVYRRTYKKK
ncbi:MAG: hypothetical protein ACI395_06250 [Candidatus Cryptobacteroides sp.]